jgi:aspartate carbamoyltransferase catalytic subunit
MWVPRELEQIGASGTQVRRVFRIEEALEDADVVLALRVQNERLHEPALPLNDYILLYQLSAERMRHAKADAIVLHPGPLNRGIEITPEVADSAQSCVLEQVTNGIAVRMALLFLLAAGGSDDDALQATEAPVPRNRRSTDQRDVTNQKDATDRKEVKDPSHASH